MGETPGPVNVGGDFVTGSKTVNQNAGGDIIGRDKITNNYAAPAVGVAALRQLPTPPADFTGRTAELDELRAAVAGAAPIGAGIFGLRGLGGVGKTALALVLAHELKERYPDAQLYVDLRGAAEQAPLAPAEVLASFIRAFQPTAQLPDSLAERQAIYRSLLAEKKALVLLDNAHDRAQVEPLLPPPGCVALVTSRQRFALPGLHTKNLDSLPRADAVALLLKIAPRIGLHADAIAQLCGDLPLALRLAGSALEVLDNTSPEGYIKRLEDKKRVFKELSEVDAALATSEALLTPHQRAKWHALAIFPATFDSWAAAAVWTDHMMFSTRDDIDHLLGELLRYSVLDYDAATRRYRLHDLARAWAESRLTDEAKETARHRQAEHYQWVLANADGLYLEGGDGVLKGLALFDQEQANIEAGQAWAAENSDANDQAAALCNAYPRVGAYVVNLRYHPRKQIAWSEAALAAARQLANKGAEGSHLGRLGLAHRALGETRLAIEYHEQALDIARAIGDRDGEGAALGSLGLAHHDLGEPRRAIEYHEQALVIAREIGDSRSEGIALGNLGIAHQDVGQTRRAIEYHEQALVIAREIGDSRSEGIALGNLGNAYAALGEMRRAIEYHEMSLIITRAIGDRGSEGLVLGNLGNAYADLGETRRAIEFYERLLIIAREIGDRRSEGTARFCVSLVLNGLGEQQAAIAQAEAALMIYEQIENPYAEKVRQKLAKWRQAEQPPAGDTPTPSQPPK